MVDRVSLEIHPGEVVGLLGPNGAGKTTTFYMVVGLLKPDEGRVFLSEREITGLPMYRRARLGISYLPQEPSVFRKLTAEENILAVLEAMGLPKAERMSRTDELLTEFGLTNVAKTKGYALSGGERRRVEICRALATRPKYMLLDEPFAGIDPLVVADLQRTIQSLAKKGIGVLITDHNVRETLKICDRAYILDQGKIIEEGEPERIASSEVAKRIYLGEEFSL